jgi:DNA-binding transcriptional ArsR family regulator
MTPLPDAASGTSVTAGPDLAGVELVSVLQALSDPVRLEMVRQLARCPGAGELACGQLQLPVSKSTVSHHLRVLHDAGVIAYREQGTRKFAFLRRDELDARFPGLLASVVRCCAGEPTTSEAST